MNEWMVVTVIVTLVGLVVAIVTPLIKLNTTITKLNTTVTVLEKNLEAVTTGNTESHKRIWTELDEHGDKLADQDKRITVIESKR